MEKNDLSHYFIEKTSLHVVNWDNFMEHYSDKLKGAKQGYLLPKLFTKKISEYGMNKQNTFYDGFMCLQNNAIQHHIADDLFVLGYMSDYGIYVEEDKEKAVQLYQLAVNQGHPISQYCLGHRYYYGRGGVTEDKDKGIQLYQLAADQGYTPAQSLLAEMYEKGEGVTKDFKKAAEYYQLTADQNYGNAQFNLAEMYVSGTGVEKDLLMAVTYFKLAEQNRYSVGPFLSRLLTECELMFYF